MKKSVLAAATAAIFAACLAHAADAPPDSKDWRPVDPDNLVLIGTKYGTVAVELSPAFAPKHVERMRALIRAHFFDGTNFYRVIEGFVAQGGVGEDTASTANKPVDPATLKKWPEMKAEFERPWGHDVQFTPSGSPDLFAKQTGHVDGFPVGRDPKKKTEWIIHCPGTFAFARDNAADTASTEFYIVIGEAPRRLDRNLTAFGRVLDGMQYVQKLNRGDPAVDNGVIADKAERPHYEVMRTDSRAFAAWKKNKKNPAPGFYIRQPPPILDICLAPVPVRKSAAKS
jgi:peptidylprolyl isomerase